MTFILGIYGGFFSGGYVTLLTAAYVMLFRMTFVEAIATTKFINIFSSLIATIIFFTTRDSKLRFRNNSWHYNVYRWHNWRTFNSQIE